MDRHRREQPLLAIRLFGGFDLQQHDAPLHSLNSPRLQALLTYLILHRHAPQSRQHIAFLFWPDSDERQAKANLRKLLHQLRQALPDADRYIAVDASTVRWRPNAPCTLDVADFQTLVDAADAAEAEGKLREAGRALEEAASLYRGDLVPGCYDSWIAPRREALYQTYLSVLERLVQLLEDQARYRTAAKYARRLLQREPLRELPYRRLMRLHALRGDRAGALAVYRQCAQRLRRELGVGPGPATQRLRQRLLSGGTTDGENSNLPEPATSFVGREDELATLARRLKDPDCRLLTIFGPGGAGKTRLAVQAARRATAAPPLQFLDGAHFVPLAAVASPDLIIPALGDALHFHFYGRRSPREQLFDYLQDKEALLVLDSFEHLNEGAPLLCDMLQHTPRLKLLVTSRVRLQVQEEWLLELSGLPAPERERARPDQQEESERAGAYAAVRLFYQRAEQVRPDISSSAEQAHVAHICRLVGGLPLAIELAAAWTTSLSCAQIAREIEQGLDLLVANVRNLPQRHHSMRAVFDHSWRLLAADEKELFRRLSIFQGSFSADAAGQIAGASPPVMDALVARSFLRRVEPGRCDIHELLREYGAERLAADAKEEAAVAGAHCSYYLHFLAQRERDLYGQQQKEALSAVGAELDNVRAAWRWATDQAKAAAMRRALRPLVRFFIMRSRFEEGVAFLEPAIDSLRDETGGTGDEERQSLLARLLAQRGGLLDRLGRYEQARADLVRSLKLAREMDDAEAAGGALYNLGVVAHHQNHYEEAQQYLQEALAISRELGNERRAAQALTSLGLLSRDAGDFEQAAQQLRQSLAIRRRLGDPFALAAVLNNLGIVAGTVGDYGEAKRRFEECLGIRRELEDRWGSALVLNNLGVLAQLREAYEEARQRLQESLAVRREIGNRWAIAITLNNLGQVALEQENHDEARDYLEESLSIRRRLKDRWGVASCLTNLGRLMVSRQDLNSARRHFSEALRLAMAVGARPLALEAVLGMAMVLAQEGEAGRALQLAGFVRGHRAADRKTQDGAEALMAELNGRREEDRPQTGPAAVAGFSLEELVASLRESTS